MSHLAKILSIITLVLTLFPCSDGYAQYQNNGMSQISLNTDDMQDHHPDNDDLCTPFCTCVCCASLIDFVESLNISQLELLNIDLNQYHNSNQKSDYINRNFQPPQV